jgi:hypothetical protein
MRQLWFLLIGVVAVVGVGAPVAKPRPGYSYSLSVNKHEMIVTSRPSGDFCLKVDGKLYKPTGKDAKWQPGYMDQGPSTTRAAIARLRGIVISLSKAGSVLDVSTSISEKDDDHDMSIITVPAGSKDTTSVRGMKPVFIDGRKAFRGKFRDDTGTNYFFKYQLRTRAHVFEITQTVCSKEYEKKAPEPFASAVKTLKVEEVK